MKSTSLFFTAILLGGICGLLSAHVFLIGWYNLLFWGAVGIVMGWIGREKKAILWAGALYGFVMSISFLLFGFQGTTDKFVGFVILSLGLGIIGALGGMLASRIGYALNRKSGRRR